MSTETRTDDKLGGLIARMEWEAEQRRRRGEVEWQVAREYGWMLDQFVIPIEDLYVKTAARLGVGGDDGPSQSLLDAVRHLAIAADAIMSAKTSLEQERASAILLDAARREAVTA